MLVGETEIKRQQRLHREAEGSISGKWMEADHQPYSFVSQGANLTPEDVARVARSPLYGEGAGLLTKSLFHLKR